MIDPPLVPICVLDLVKKKIAPREDVLAPWLKVKNLVMIHGPRGAGKSQVALSLALSISSGEKFLEWNAPRPRRVLYLDGEMPEAMIQERAKGLMLANRWAPKPNALRLYINDAAEVALPNISTQQGQDAVAAMLEGVEVLIIDNLSTLASAGNENDSESWSAMQSWLLSLRRKGLTVIMAHHSGKGGLQRGTSRREDVLDTVIGLKWPSDYDPAEGCRFEMRFEKARGLMGDAVQNLELKLASGTDGSACWISRPIQDVRADKVKELATLDMSVREIAEETSIPKSTVHRILKDLEAKGASG